MQGEMSATVTRYPRDWESIIYRLRQRVVNAAAAAGVHLPSDQVRGARRGGPAP